MKYWDEIPFGEGTLLVDWFRRALDRAPETGRVLTHERYRQGLAQSQQIAEDRYSVPSELVGVDLRCRYAWAMPSRENIETLAAIGRRDGLLEIGSGSGYWSAILSHHVNIIAADNGSWDRHWRQRWREPDMQDATDALRAHPDRAVLTVFPVPEFADAVDQEIAAGRRLITVGPRMCTGSRRMHETLDTWYDQDRLMSTPNRDATEPADIEVLTRRATPLEHQRVFHGDEDPALILGKRLMKSSLAPEI